MLDSSIGLWAPLICSASFSLLQDGGLVDLHGAEA